MVPGDAGGNQVTHQESVRPRCDLLTNPPYVWQRVVDDPEERNIGIIHVEHLAGKAFDTLLLDPDGNPNTLHLRRDAFAALLEEQAHPVDVFSKTLTAIVFKDVRDVVDCD